MPRVVVVAPSDVLTHALSQSLSAWNIQIEGVPDDNPGPTMPSSSAEGRRIAEHYDALAVVWVSESDDGFALWVFDGRTNRVVARPLPSGPPFDEPMAAQVALIVKTLLRSIPELAPDAPNHRHNADRQEPPTVVAPAHEESLVESSPVEVNTPHDTVLLGWDVLVAGGVRGYATSPNSPDARFLLGVTLWPGGQQRALGLSILVESGPGIRSAHTALDARWTDSSLMFGVRGRLHLGAHFDLGATLGLGVRFTTLRGETSARSQVAQLHINPTSRVDLELGMMLIPWLRIELRAGTTIGWSVQRYFTGDDLALEVVRFGAHALLGLEFQIR
ncbi:MAG: hypothetical protein ACI9KE_001953 [Polyangiales bacterium]|jgi:hypothetical protein